MQDWIKIGEKCVCVNDNWTLGILGLLAEDVTRLPMLNEVLTIADIKEAHDNSGRLFISFEEIPLSQGRVYKLQYLSTHFRPLRNEDDVFEEDMQIFRPMLKDLPVEEDA